MPTYWLILSGVFFVLSILANLAIIIGVWVVVGKVSPLIKNINGKVETLGSKATDIATTAQTTVHTVHDRTTHILGSTEAASSEVTRKIAAAGTAITAVFVATRIVGTLRGMAGDGHKRRVRA